MTQVTLPVSLVQATIDCVVTNVARKPIEGKSLIELRVGWKKQTKDGKLVDRFMMLEWWDCPERNVPQVGDGIIAVCDLYGSEGTSAAGNSFCNNKARVTFCVNKTAPNGRDPIPAAGALPPQLAQLAANPALLQQLLTMMQAQQPTPAATNAATAAGAVLAVTAANGDNVPF